MLQSELKAIFDMRSDFYKKYSKKSIPYMLKKYYFSVTEAEVDDEDIVYMEEYKQYLLTMGIVEEQVPFKKEFIAEYAFSKSSSLIVEGYYLRKPTGEKMYTSYYYTVYRKGYVKKKGDIGITIYLEKATKQRFLKWFERYLNYYIRGGNQ